MKDAEVLLLIAQKMRFWVNVTWKWPQIKIQISRFLHENKVFIIIHSEDDGLPLE